MGTSVLEPPKLQPPEEGARPPGNNRLGGPGGSGGDGQREPPSGSIPPEACRIGMWIGIVSISMLFAALTTAMVVRAGTSAEWVRTQIPHALYFNTAILFLSSATLEISRGFLREGAGRRFAQWLYITTTLGIAFIAGQLYAWHELAVQGIYLTTNPSSSFFYVLTAAHGLHLLGGVAGLFYLVLRSPQIIVAPRRRIAVDVTAIYWHFMDGLWIYLLVLLVVKL